MIHYSSVVVVVVVVVCVCVLVSLCVSLCVCVCVCVSVCVGGGGGGLLNAQRHFREEKTTTGNQLINYINHSNRYRRYIFFQRTSPLTLYHNIIMIYGTE